MAERKARVAVLVSGGGTNLQAILDRQQEGIIHSGEVVLVISNVAGAYALTRAEKAGIATRTFTRKELGSRQHVEERILQELDQQQIDLVVLAGFMQILSSAFTGRYAGRILNVHPSLIPAFCGEGYYGLRVHEAALARGVKVTGATVHLVNEIPDGGPILLQKAVSVLEGDTPEVLQRRVMEEAEWQILPAAVEMLSAQIVKEEKGEL